MTCERTPSGPPRTKAITSSRLAGRRRLGSAPLAGRRLAVALRAGAVREFRGDPAWDSDLVSDNRSDLMSATVPKMKPATLAGRGSHRLLPRGSATAALLLRRWADEEIGISLAPRRRGREPCGRCGFDRGRRAAPAGQGRRSTKRRLLRTLLTWVVRLGRRSVPKAHPSAPRLERLGDFRRELRLEVRLVDPREGRLRQLEEFGVSRLAGVGLDDGVAEIPEHVGWATRTRALACRAIRPAIPTECGRRCRATGRRPRRR